MKQAFGPWNPDHASINMTDSQGRLFLTKARNTQPCIAGWMPIPSLQPYAASALPTRCVGLTAAIAPNGAWNIFAGTKTKLYRYNSGTRGWDDFTRVAGGNYNVPDGELWSFTQFGTLLIAANINDNPQVIDVNTGATHFADLAGGPPKARYVGVVGDFLVLSCLSTDNRMLMNSAINNATGWTLAVNLCDQQEFPDGGNITGLVGGEYGWVIQQTAIRRMIFQPQYDIAFRFERIEHERGASSLYSVVAAAGRAYFRYYDGFYSLDSANGLQPIGYQRINDWFTENSDPARHNQIISFNDLTGPRVYWAFYSSPNSTYFDRRLGYDWKLDRWFYTDEPAQFWAREVTSALTLEGLDVYGSIDTGVPFSLDSAAFSGGIPVVSGVMPNGLLGFSEGPALDATLVTCPVQLIPGARANVTSLFPSGLINDGVATVRVGRTENTSNSFNYTPLLSPSPATGLVRCKASGRLHQFEVNFAAMTSGNEWEHMGGLDIEMGPDGTK